MPFAGNLRTLPLPDVFQTLNNIKATGVLRLESSAGARDVVFQQGEIIGVGFLDKAGRNDLELRLTLLGIGDEAMQERLKGVTWYWSAMQARTRLQQTNRAELDELVHEQAREQLHNLFAWNTADFHFDESGPGKDVANEMVARCLERPLSIDTSTLLLEAARQQDEWADLRARIRDETGAAAMGSQPAFAAQPSEPAAPEDPPYHLYLDGEWRGPFLRSAILGLVQTGEVPPETWSYDPRTQERETLDKIFGAEARRITPEELDALRQAVKAAENRLAEERAGRVSDQSELRGLAGEVLRVASEIRIEDPALSAVVERLSESVSGHDPSLVALAAETVVVSLVRHLRDNAISQLAAAREEAGQLAGRIATLERTLAEERAARDAQLAKAEQRADAEREAAAQLRERLAEAASDAARLDQELERTRRDPSHISTARISALRTPDDVTAARAGAETAARARSDDTVRELGRMRAEHARLLNEIATLQGSLDEERSRHEAELEASRAVAATLGESSRPAATAVDANLVAEIERLKGLLAAAEARTGRDSEVRRAIEARDAALHDSERLRHELLQARSDSTLAGELATRADEARERLHAAEARAEQAERRARQSEGDLSSIRERLEQAEAQRTSLERKANDAARQNAELQIRLRELAQRLEEGENRLAELGELAQALTEARARVAELAAEGGRIRNDLEAVRRQGNEKVERLRLRIISLKDRLRSARRSAQDRDSSALRAAVPWPSPATATYAAAPAAPQAMVPWPSPVTATYAAHPATQPPAWPAPAASPPLASPSGSFPLESDGAPPTRRTDSANQLAGDRPTQVWSNPSPIRRPARAWAIAAGSIAVIAVALAWLSSSVPIASRAVINARTIAVVSTIPGTTGDLLTTGSRVTAGAEIGRVRNDELDPTQLNTLRDRKQANQTRLLAADESLRRAESEFTRLTRELAEQPAAALAAESEPKRLLRDEYAARVVEIKGLQDDLRARIAELEGDIASEQRRRELNRIASLSSPVEGVLWKVNPSGTISAGVEVARIAETDSVLILAELDATWEDTVKKGDKAIIRFGSTEFVARVARIGVEASDMGALAIQPLPTAGTLQVILEVEPDLRRTLCQHISKGARVAFADPSRGIFTRLALALRF